MEIVTACKALANDRRIQILEWLRDPVAHFPTQMDGDLVEDGVCGIRIAEKLGVTQSTLSEHMRLLVASGLVDQKRVKQWTFYRRNADRVAELAHELGTRV